MKIYHRINKKLIDAPEGYLKKNCCMCNDLLMEDYYILGDAECEDAYKGYVVVCLKCLKRDAPESEILELAGVLLTLQIL